MGNAQQTTDGSNKSLKQIVDFVATNYILTQNFQDMRKLSDMKYCNKLVLLTSKVFENKLRDIDVEYLAQRTKDGQEINVMANDKVKVINKSDLPNLDVKVETDKRRLCLGIAKYYVKIAHIYAAIVTTIKPNYVYNEGASTMPKPMPMPMPSANTMPMPSANLSANPMPMPMPSANTMPSANISANISANTMPMPKPSANLSANLSANPMPMPSANLSANPMPMPKPSANLSANTMPSANLSANTMPMPKPSANLSANTMPSANTMQAGGEGEVEVSLPQKQTIPTGADVKVKINNICSNRLNALMNNQDFSGENLTVKPNFCKMNLESGTNKSRTLASEPGIPELMTLYYNKYDYDHGGFMGFKSKENLKSGEVDMQAVYLNDVKKFYKLFTGKDDVPADVITFSDIPLKAYHLSKGCQANGVYTTAYKGTTKDKLFKTYADHIKEMMNTTESNQNKLLAIIDRIFVFNVNPVSKEREVTIKMGLTEKELAEIVEDTRKIIVNLYIKCEEDFLEGLEIFEAIVENQIKDTTQVQVSELQNIIDSKLGESDLGEIIEPVAAAKANEEKAKEKAEKAKEIEKENIRLKIAEREKTPAVLLEPSTIESATLGPATLGPAMLGPATLGPSKVETVLVSDPAVVISEPATTTSNPLPDSFVEKAKIYLPSFVKGGVRRY